MGCILRASYNSGADGFEQQIIIDVEKINTIVSSIVAGAAPLSEFTSIGINRSGNRACFSSVWIKPPYLIPA